MADEEVSTQSETQVTPADLTVVNTIVDGDKIMVTHANGTTEVIQGNKLKDYINGLTNTLLGNYSENIVIDDFDFDPSTIIATNKNGIVHFVSSYNPANKPTTQNMFYGDIFHSKNVTSLYYMLCYDHTGKSIERRYNKSSNTWENIDNLVTNTELNSALTTQLANYREVRVGEIYNSNSYWKVEVNGFYGRPLLFNCYGSSGLYDICMFGIDCTKKLIRIGNSSTQITYKFKNPSASGNKGTLYIKSNQANISHTIFFTGLFSKENPRLLEATEEEWNNATSF